MNEFLNKSWQDYLPLFPDNFFDLAIEDPQYGLNQSAEKIRSRGKLAKTIKIDSYTWDNERESKEYINELFRVSKMQIIWGGNYYADLLPASSGWIAWDKVNGNTNFSDIELAWTSFNRGARKFTYMWNGMMQAAGIINGDKQRGDKSKNEIRIHPTQKPIDLYRWILHKYAQPGFKILDSHAGSGSSIIACEIECFDIWACEKDYQIWKNATKRINEYRKQLRIKF